VEELKRALAAHAIFAINNRDVAQAIRSEGDDILYQNAVAEFLFSRLPADMEDIIYIDSRPVREKLFGRIARLEMTAAQKAGLYAYFPANLRGSNLKGTLDRMEEVSRKMNIPEESKLRLRSYITSIRKDMERLRKVYRELFLDRRTAALQKLHIPMKVMQTEITYNEKIIREYTDLSVLDFYPTKDWLDLYKYKKSADCTGICLGEDQLRTPQFFNIRIFRGNDWIGNIYMLDLTRITGDLVVDRIQIPRHIRAEYLNFFDYLKDVFIRIFEDVSYGSILLPVTISNHNAIQQIWNNYRRNLDRKIIRISESFSRHFESLSRKKRTCYVLCSDGDSD